MEIFPVGFILVGFATIELAVLASLDYHIPCNASLEVDFEPESCYIKFSDGLTRNHSGARTWCKRHGYHLPIITSDKEENFAKAVDIPAEFWTDGYKRNSEWVWQGTGQGITCVQGAGEDNSKRCVLFQSSGSNHFRAKSCGDTHEVVCERPVSPNCTADAQCANGNCDMYGKCRCWRRWREGPMDFCSTELVPTATPDSSTSLSTTTQSNSPWMTSSGATTPADTKLTTPAQVVTDSPTSPDFTTFTTTPVVDSTTAQAVTTEESTTTSVATTRYDTVELATSTEAPPEPYPDVDFSALQGLLLDDLFNTPVENPRENPFYLLATYCGTLETKYSQKLQVSGANDVIPGRGGLGLYKRLTSAHSWLNPVYDSRGMTCVEQGLAGCDRGFALSLWVLLGQEAMEEGGTVLLHAGAKVDDVELPHLGIFIDEDKRVNFQVNDGNQVWTVTVPTKSVPIGSWCNLAMTWRPASSLHAYINSYKVGVLNVVPLQRQSVTMTPSSSTWVVTVGGKGQRPTTSPIAVSDFVIWGRYLYEFENHLYLGVTADELQVLQGADYLWSTDGYLRRDQLALQTQPGIAALGPIAYSSKPARVPGRDKKGWALNADGVSDQWLALDDFTGTCVSDPALCAEGITIALWVQVHRPVSASDTAFAFIFSSGGQSSRGCALYQRGGNRLRAAVVDGRREWVVEVRFATNEAQWVHLAISWRQTSGLVLYINGDSQGRDRRGRVRLRHHDLDGWLLVGRRNDYVTGYANVTLEQLAIWEHYIEPWQARRAMGLIENYRYATATFYWNQHRFISSTFDLLGSGTVSMVDVKVPYADVVDLSSPRAHLNLSDFSGTCIAEPAEYSDGLSVSLWLRYQQGILSNTPSFILKGRDFEIMNGFIMYVRNATLSLVVQRLAHAWAADLDMEYFPEDIWTNVACTWSETQNLTLYINGVQLSQTVYHFFEEQSNIPNRNPQLILGATSNPVPSEFQVQSLAVWERYMKPLEVAHLLGMSESELYCFKNGDYCWSFEPTLRLRHPFDLSPTGATFTSGLRERGTAVCTDGRSGWLTLGDFSAQCPALPSACEHGFIVALWVKLTEVTSHRHSGYLLSVGAEEHGESGFSLFQSVTGIWVKLVDDNLSWETNLHPSRLTFAQWIYLTVKWTGQSFEISIGDKKLPTITHVYVSNHHGSHTHFEDDAPIMTLGKSIHGNRGFLSACYDDVLLMMPERAGQDLPFRSLNSSVHEYENQFEVVAPGPETKEECNVIHEADCAMTIEELLYVIQDEKFLSASAVASSMSKLSHLTQSNTRLSSTELAAATELIARLANRTLPMSTNDTQIEMFLEEFLGIVNNLLNPVHAEEWISLQKTNVGTTSIMESVEAFTNSITSHWNTTTPTSLTDKLISKSHIITSMEFVPRDYFSGQKDLVIPQRTGPSWQSLEDKWRTADDGVAILEELIQSASTSMGAIVSFTLYDTLQEIVPITSTNGFTNVEGKHPRVNSRILSLGVEPAFKGTLDQPILITLTHQTTVSDLKTEKAVCAFWRFDAPHTIYGAWDTEGCEVQSTSQTQTVCRCYHLTHFAIIMESVPLEELSENAIILRWLVRCLVSLSVLLLVILIIMYIMSKRLHTLRHSIHLNQCLASLVSSVVFGLSKFTSDNEVLCLASGAAMHYFYLAVILWSTMETCQLYRDTTEGGMDTSDAIKGFAVRRTRMGYYMIGAWGIPAVAVGCVLGVSLKAYQPQVSHMCWLVEDNGMPWAYSAPCCMALCVNIFVLIMVMRGADSTVRKLDRTSGFRSGVRATIIFSFLFAVTWVVGWKAIYSGPLWTTYLFVILNSLQGFCVFVLQGFGNVEVRALLCRDDPDLELALANDTKLVLEKPSEEKQFYISRSPSGPDQPCLLSPRKLSHQVTF